MRAAIHGGMTLLAAFLAQAVLGRSLADLGVQIDVFLLAAILFAMIKGELAGAVLGAAAGLIADGFASGVFGINGIVFIVIGYLSGWVSRRINVVAFFRAFAFIALLAAAGMGLRLVLTIMILGGPIPWARGALLLEPPLMAAAGAATLAVLRGFRKSYAR